MYGLEVPQPTDKAIKALSAAILDCFTGRTFFRSMDAIYARVGVAHRAVDSAVQISLRRIAMLRRITSKNPKVKAQIDACMSIWGYGTRWHAPWHNGHPCKPRAPPIPAIQSGVADGR